MNVIEKCRKRKLKRKIESIRKDLGRQSKRVLISRYKRIANPELLGAVVGSYDYDHSRVMRKISRYKRFGVFVLLSIPILSTIIASAVNVDPDAVKPPTLPIFKLLHEWVPVLSLVLAILSTMNSIFKPSSRFAKACEIESALDRWRFQFLKGLRVNDLEKDSDLASYLHGERESLRKIQKDHVFIALPEQMQ
ncbi:MAG: hypothetical protein JXR25_14860 [Pontiellaceae bacterium]|nr:hypothetical protein [Pontiellaceae bacterium]MBN2786100.1 hypothetical protein [Pontiellaceae bacterium]